MILNGGWSVLETLKLKGLKLVDMGRTALCFFFENSVINYCFIIQVSNPVSFKISIQIHAKISGLCYWIDHMVQTSNLVPWFHCCYNSFSSSLPLDSRPCFGLWACLQRDKCQNVLGCHDTVLWNIRLIKLSKTLLFTI